MSDVSAKAANPARAELAIEGFENLEAQIKCSIRDHKEALARARVRQTRVLRERQSLESCLSTLRVQRQRLQQGLPGPEVAAEADAALRQQLDEQDRAIQQALQEQSRNQQLYRTVARQLASLELKLQSMLGQYRRLRSFETIGSD